MSTTPAGESPPCHGQGRPQNRDSRKRKKQFKVRLRMSQIEAVFRVAHLQDTHVTTFIRVCGLRRARTANPRDDPSTIVNVWLDDDERATIEAAANREHTKPATFLRDAAISYAANAIRPSSPGNGGARGHQPESRPSSGPAPRNNGGVGFVR